MRTRQEIISKINEKNLEIKLINESDYIISEEILIELEVLAYEVQILEWVLNERD